MMADPLAAPDLRRTSVLFDVAVAVLCGGAALLVNAELSTASHIADALIVVALATRRAAPTVMMATAVASAALQVATGDLTSLSVLYAPMFHTVGGHRFSAVRRGSLAVAIVGSVVAGVTLAVVYPNDAGGMSDVFAVGFGIAGTALVVVGGWALGYIGYQRREVAAAEISETIAELERRRVVDLYDEQAHRSRLARDMHDVVAHSLAVVVAQAEGARYTLDADPQAARDALGVIANTAREALADVRGVLEELRSTDTASEAGRIDREQLFDRMRAAGMTVESTEEGSADDAAPFVVRTVFGVLTEALTNALKYGDLDRPVHVRHDWTSGCVLTVRNTPAQDPLAPGGARHGIIGMRERAGQAGGTLTAERDGDDWLVVLTVPRTPSDQPPIDQTPSDQPPVEGLP